MALACQDVDPLQSSVRHSPGTLLPAGGDLQQGRAGGQEGYGVAVMVSGGRGKGLEDYGLLVGGTDGRAMGRQCWCVGRGEGLDDYGLLVEGAGGVQKRACMMQSLLYRDQLIDSTWLTCLYPKDAACAHLSRSMSIACVQHCSDWFHQ